MVEIFKSQKHVFWQALILAVFIFSSGILLGFIIENWRTSQIKELYFQSELDLLDIKIQSEIYSFSEIDCTAAIRENINFADRIYSEAIILKREEESNKLSDSMILQHKKYDLLRTLFWINAIKIKKRCNADYHDVVYIYDYQNPSIETKAKQSVFSNILAELKQGKGDDIMLITIAGDNDLISVNLMMAEYGIEKTELPIILIDEKTKVTSLEKVEDIEKLIR